MPVNQGAGLTDAERYPGAAAVAQQLRIDFPGNPQGLEAKATGLIQAAQARGDTVALADAVRARMLIRYGVW